MLTSSDFTPVPVNQSALACLFNSALPPGLIFTLLRGICRKELRYSGVGIKLALATASHGRYGRGFLAGLPLGGFFQGHVVFGSDPLGRCERIGPLTFEFTAVCKLKKVAEPRVFLCCKSVGYGRSPLVLQTPPSIVSTFVVAMG